MSLEERRVVADEIKKASTFVLSSLLGVMGIEVEKTDRNDVHFTIGGKKYYLYVNVNRDRKGHMESVYVGKSCGMGIDDSAYDEHWVDEEEE